MCVIKVKIIIIYIQNNSTREPIEEDKERL